MNESSSNLDAVDLLLALVLFGTFIAFGVCLWLLKREMNKKKAANQNPANKQG